MVTPRLKVLACALSSITLFAACGEAGFVDGSGGTSGVGGSGGMPDPPDPIFNCVTSETGCNDGNDCTVDGVCESTTQMCVGRQPEPVDTPCGTDGIFVCNGEGRCVGCNVDAQCDVFFPDEECRSAPRCVEHSCPLPEPLPDGTACSTGECRSGVCSSPWALKRQLVPMLCGTTLDESVFESPMDLTVAPVPIQSGGTFSASLTAAILVPRDLLQDAVLASFPEPLHSLSVSGARAELKTTGVVSGSPVQTTLARLPQDLWIPQGPNPGDAGGQLCGGGGPGCPLTQFGQQCALEGVCECACRPGCEPAECANLVVADGYLTMETIQGAIYSSANEGEVCFDVAGNFADPTLQAPIRTGVRMQYLGGDVAIECAGGFVDDNGTPQVRNDDFLSPNGPAQQVCFPIGPP